MSRPQIRTSDQPQYLNLADAAQRYGCSPRTLRRYIATGALNAFRFGPRMVRIDATELDNLMRRIPSGGGAA